MSQLASSEVDSTWIPGLGNAAHVVSRSFFSHRHLDFSVSVLDGLDSLDSNGAFSIIHDLALQFGTANCELQAQLLAHVSLSRLLPVPWEQSGINLPRFEFHGGTCCRRYHVLTHVLEMLLQERDRNGLLDAPLHFVEVGVNNALTSEYLLSRFPDVVFDGIDPYFDAEDIFQEASARLRRFTSRARLRRVTSLVGATAFRPGSLDLVFIDGDHSRDAVAADLLAWRPLVRHGGLLAGHDLFNLAFEGVLESVLEHVSMTANHSGIISAAPFDTTVHFAPDFVWWLQV